MSKPRTQGTLFAVEIVTTFFSLDDGTGRASVQEPAMRAWQEQCFRRGVELGYLYRRDEEVKKTG